MSGNVSPYHGKNPGELLTVTEGLIASHPLKTTEILEVAETCWSALWLTTIGNQDAQIALREVYPPATVVGYFFEKLFAKELAKRHPDLWRGATSGTEKDLHYIPDPKFSIEVKTSGQLGLKIFGNRSYGQKVENEALAKKDKSGFYITVNFFGERMNLLRFGWIDGSDWKAQKSATGQMAGLDDYVYSEKLIPIKGNYALQAPVMLLPGAGAKTAEALNAAGFATIGDLARADNATLSTLSPKVLRVVMDGVAKFSRQYVA